MNNERLISKFLLRLFFSRFLKFQQKNVITRKDAQEAKMKTRAMVKGTERKISLVEAKRNSRQRMVKTAADNVVKDIYGNVRKAIRIWLCNLCHLIFILGSQLN